MATITLKDLRRKIYIKAKNDPTWRFWGMYVHVTKMETLMCAYKQVKKNNSSCGIDGMTFEDIEGIGIGKYLSELREELLNGQYLPQKMKKVEIPKANGKRRTLSIPTIRDRIVQAAMKLILEPIFEADFQEGSYGFRPKRSAHQAITHVKKAIWQDKTRVIDLDISSFFDNVRHHILLVKVAKRVSDPKVLHLLKLILKANGKKGISQGGVISPLLANIYLNDVDKMLERAKEVTRVGKRTQLEYARYADDLVILLRANRKLTRQVNKRLKEEYGKIEVELNEEKSKIVDLTNGESFSFLGFEFRRLKCNNGKYRPNIEPTKVAKAKFVKKIKEEFKHHRSQPLEKIIEKINPILRGWLNYFRIGNSAKCFARIKRWIEKRIRIHLMRAKQRHGFGWKRWSTKEIFKRSGIYNDFKIRYL
jgi:RNA-directed DNA polymerase